MGNGETVTKGFWKEGKIRLGRGNRRREGTWRKTGPEVHQGKVRGKKRVFFGRK